MRSCVLAEAKAQGRSVYLAAHVVYHTFITIIMKFIFSKFCGNK